MIEPVANLLFIFCSWKALPQWPYVTYVWLLWLWDAVVYWTWLFVSKLLIKFHFSLSCIGEGNGDPLQCSCLENPRDEGAWWAAVSGVAQSRTRLKRLSSSSSSSSTQYWMTLAKLLTGIRRKFKNWSYKSHCPQEIHNLGLI